MFARSLSILMLASLCLLPALLLGACIQPLQDPGTGPSAEAAAEEGFDHGHFDGSSLAFRNWDDVEQVAPACAKCHTAGGLPRFLRTREREVGAPSDGLNCGTCHSDEETRAIHPVERVEFPSGAQLSLAEVDRRNGPGSALCLECHQGRRSTASVDEEIGDLADGQVEAELGFINVHYGQSGATLFGAEAEGGYQYAGQDYAGRYTHVADFDTCSECHDVHSSSLEVGRCGACHRGVQTVEDLGRIRETGLDFDGDGDTTEGMAAEIETLHQQLLQAMQQYATEREQLADITYEDRSPFFFDSDGKRYDAWTPELLRAAYNYHYLATDTGAYVHNPIYAIQLLQDSLGSLGSDTSRMVRP